MSTAVVTSPGPVVNPHDCQDCSTHAHTVGSYRHLENSGSALQTQLPKGAPTIK